MDGEPAGRVALALQGGGAHGAFTWGVLDRLLEQGFVPDAICAVRRDHRHDAGAGPGARRLHGRTGRDPHLCVSIGDYPNPDAPLHWRQNRDFSGNNIMALGIWYEQMARWAGHAASAFAVGQVVVKHRRDEAGARAPITIPDHIDVTGQLQQGGQYRLLLSSVLGHTPNKVEAWIFGDKGTLAFITPNDGEAYLRLGKKGGTMGPLAIDPAKRGDWRVEEEFVNAVRGREAVTHTDFVTAVKYMEWTDAVTLSMRERREVQLPLV